MLVEDLKQTELANEDWEFTRLIPNKCMLCGKPLVMSLINTGLSCSDEFCSSKVARRCSEFLKDVRFTGIGYAQMLAFCQVYDLRCPVELFLLEPSDLEGYSDGSATQQNFLNLIEHLDKYRKPTLQEFLIYAKMPSIQDSTAEALAKNYSNLEVFLNTIQIENIGLIQELLGINEESSLRAIKIFEQLSLHDSPLREVVAQGAVEITSVNIDLSEVLLVISDSAGANWKTKSDFQDYVIDRFSNKFNIVFKGSVTKKTTILIAEDGTQTSKVQKAERYGIPVMNGDTFIMKANETSNINDIVN